ncbi:MAG TPA: nuclear transport factor 2 family protein [Nocardioidaceae bacterium]|nr:nuclear transport factor 2 family protein [Nocardioidaceae bacterium]
MIETDAVTWTAPDGDHPARRASQRSAATVARGSKEDWLALFAPDAVVEDPVGPSVFDPDGKGHRGHEGIGRFWDQAIAGVQAFHFTITDSFANGDSCANVGTISTTLEDGTRIDTEGVFVYRTDEAGLITSIRAHWEFDRAMATATKV